jgi:hypothetical protein
MNTSIAAVLESLRDEQGLLHIERVVEVAADPESPLHNHFEWNDGDAAHRYRLNQARTLIRAQKIPVRIGPAVIRSVAYVPAVNMTGAYQLLSEITPSSDLARSVMLNELKRVGGALGRARNIAAVLNLQDEIDHLLAALATIVEKAAAPQPAEPA